MHGTRLSAALLASVATSLVLIPTAGSSNGSALIIGNVGTGQTNSATANTTLNTTAVLGLAVEASSVNATAVKGSATATTGASGGVLGTTDSTGGFSTGVLGVLSSSTPGASSAGVKGITNSQNQNGPGVYGLQLSASGDPAGVLGETHSGSPSSAGVRGISTANAVCCVPGVWGSNTSSGFGWGVLGDTGSQSPGIGVFGRTGAGPSVTYGVEGNSSSSAANAAGVFGLINSAAANAAGVRGQNSGNCCGMGVAGFHTGSGIGVYGEAQNGFAVSGFSPNNWSGYFQGSVNVVGTLFKSSGAFRIDNPIDPAHSYLQHSFVESPDMKNVYDGVVRTNGKGFATVTLPNWFEGLNKNFRYQLTIVGRRGWRARVVKEIAKNRFTIQSDEPRVKVSWQVTGIRHDAYANAHRIQTVVPKSGSADGKYVHPDLYGKPMSKSVVVLPGMTAATKPKVEQLRLKGPRRR